MFLIFCHVLRFQALNIDDLAGLKTLMSDELLKKQPTNLEASLKEIESQLSTYKLIGEYYTESTLSDGELQVMSGTSFKDHVVRYPATNRHTYVSLMVADRDEELGDLLIAIVYGKYGKEWKINSLDFGTYSLHGKTAPDYYELAKRSYEKGYLADALGYMEVSLTCLTPANSYFGYHSSLAISDFYERVSQEAKKKWGDTFVFTGVSTEPEFFKFSMKNIDGGVFPLIQYISKINIDDVDALTIENKKIRAIAPQYFNGIDKDKKYIFYRVFNQLPKDDNQAYYEFKDELLGK